MLELVIFDVDGLMIDTESVWKEAFDKAGDKYGIPDLGDTLFPSLIGKRLGYMIVLIMLFVGMKSQSVSQIQKFI